MDRKRGKLTSLESLIPKVSQKMGIESRLRELMIMNYWSEIAKGDIGKESKPNSLRHTPKGLVLFVGAKSSMVAQELSIIKLALLDKINVLASQIGFKISDIVISAKYWIDDAKEDADKSEKINTIKELDIKETIDIDSIELSESQKDQIEEALTKLDFDEEIKNRMKKLLERDVKIKRFKEERGFPVCKNCGVRLVNFDDLFCPSCNLQ